MSVSDVEKRLAKYRAQKERENKVNKYKSKVKNIFVPFFGEGNGDQTPKSGAKPSKTDTGDSKENLYSKSEKDEHFKSEKACSLKSDSDRLSLTDSEFDEEDDNVLSLSYFDYVYYGLTFILWATVYAIFVKLQFGTIYFIISLLLGIYLNTRTGPKRRNEVSAYSVFNRNCESIDGTLKAEDLEKQMLYGGFR